MSLIISSIQEPKNSYQKKERNIYMNYLRSGPEHLENDEDYNDRLEHNIGDEGMQNLEDYQSCHSENLQHQHVTALIQQNNTVYCSHVKESYNSVFTVATRASEVVISSSIKGEVEH